MLKLTVAFIITTCSFLSMSLILIEAVAEPVFETFKMKEEKDTTVIAITEPEPYQGDITLNELFAQINWDVTNLNWTFELKEPKPGFLGLTFPSEKRVDLYMNGEMTSNPEFAARILAHELGHVLDVEKLSWDDRAAWAKLQEFDNDVPHWPVIEGSDDGDSGAGDFAECFAKQFGPSGFESRSNVSDLCAEDARTFMLTLAD